MIITQGNSRLQQSSNRNPVNSNTEDDGIEKYRKQFIYTTPSSSPEQLDARGVTFRGISPHGEKGEQENISKPLWTIAVLAIEDSHKPWAGVVSAVRPSPRYPSAKLSRVAMPWCLAIYGTRATTALCPVPGSRFWLCSTNIGAATAALTSPASWCPGLRLLCWPTLLIFQCSATRPLGPNT